MQNKELVEYHWNELTQTGEFVYENPNDPTDFVVETREQKFAPPMPSLEAYWGELIWYLNSQAGVEVN